MQGERRFTPSAPALGMRLLKAASKLRRVYDTLSSVGGRPRLTDDYFIQVHASGRDFHDRGLRQGGGSLKDETLTAGIHTDSLEQRKGVNLMCDTLAICEGPVMVNLPGCRIERYTCIS